MRKSMNMNLRKFYLIKINMSCSYSVVFHNENLMLDFESYAYKAKNNLTQNTLRTLGTSFKSACNTVSNAS